MAQDIRSLLQSERKLPSEGLSKGHELRFMDRLEKEMPAAGTVNSTWTAQWTRIAAGVAVILCLGTGWYFSFTLKDASNSTVVTTEKEEAPYVLRLPKESALASVSPEYKQIEEYYTTNVKQELASLEVTTSNKELVDNFMLQLEQLDLEYQKLNAELLEFGASEHTIEALIENLQFRLDLMTRLKDKLKKLKNMMNETYEDQQV